MSNVEETAYPRLRDAVTAEELDQLFTRSTKERRFVADTYRRALPQACLMLQLKLVQRLGYAVPLASVPLPIVVHVCRKLKITRPTREQLTLYDESGEKTRHLRLVLQLLSLRAVDAEGERWLQARAKEAAQTKQELPDIINVLLEELINQSYILPGFSFLDRMASKGREEVNTGIYDRTTAALDDATRSRLDEILATKGGKSDWEPPRRTGHCLRPSRIHHVRHRPDAQASG